MIKAISKFLCLVLAISPLPSGGLHYSKNYSIECTGNKSLGDNEPPISGSHHGKARRLCFMVHCPHLATTNDGRCKPEGQPSSNKAHVLCQLGVLEIHSNWKLGKSSAKLSSAKQISMTALVHINLVNLINFLHIFH